MGAGNGDKYERTASSRAFAGRHVSATGVARCGRAVLETAKDWLSSPAQCPGACVIERCSPWSVPFPPRPPWKLALLCSTGSPVLRHSPSPARACPPFGLWPSRTGLRVPGSCDHSSQSRPIRKASRANVISAFEAKLAAVRGPASLTKEPQSVSELLVYYTFLLHGLTSRSAGIAGAEVSERIRDFGSSFPARTCMGDSASVDLFEARVLTLRTYR